MARFTPRRELGRTGFVTEQIRQRAVEAMRDKGPCWWNPEPQRLDLA